jgi:hypothetical protein
MKTTIYLLLILTAITSFGQVKHPSSVMGAGGEVMRTATHTIQGTVSQFAIDYLSHSQGAHGVGFWYQPSLLYKFRDNSSYIVIPNVAANSGEFVNIPIILESSNRLLQSGAHTFEAKIRFNKSLLEPLEPMQFEEVGNNYILTVRGEAKDTVGILAMMRFRSRLGNDSITPLVFESFRWIETTKIKITTQNGEFVLNDLCKAGGTTRLVKKGITLSLAPITPNPAKHTTKISFVLNERTTMRLTVVDLMGREVAPVQNQEVNSGSYEINLDVSLIADGKYFVVLRTDNDVVFQPLQIVK